MDDREYQYAPLDPKRPGPWRGTCEDCGRGIDPGEEGTPATVCPHCERVRGLEKSLLGVAELLTMMAADIATMKRVTAPHAPGGIAVPVLHGQVKLR